MRMSSGLSPRRLTWKRAGDRHMKITDFDIKISAENVCAFLDGDKTGGLYEEIMDELEEMLPQAYEKIRPTVLLEFGSLEGYSIEADGKPVEEALFGVCSIGKEMGEWSTSLFAQGDYLGGMLVDAIADDYLFQMDDAIQETVVAICREHGRGIAGRAEAPKDLPMSIQKRAWEVTQAGEEGIGIKESFMYDPVKTVCHVYLLDDNTKRYHPEHDCSKCNNLTCKRRNLPSVNIRVVTGEKETVIKGRKTDSLLKTLQEHDIFIPAVCGGRGTCGKCSVRFTYGAVEPSEEDRRFFPQEKLEEGYRLACRAYPGRSCTVIIDERESSGFFVLTDEGAADPSNDDPACGRARDESAGQKEAVQIQGDPADLSYGIAVDIGTTTIAMQLLELPEGRRVDVFTDINRQRAYGADVISRIEASNAGQKEELRKSICEQLLTGLHRLTEGRQKTVSRMVVGGNSTMIHLLMGYSCETLGVYPFTPVDISLTHTTSRELLGTQEQDFDIMICPGVSTYVGGDITAGMYALDFDKREKPCVLVDLGTNGEMAIGCKDRILVTSTAAGPAFEGGNIVCGTGSIPGAICKIELDGENVKLETIGNEEPRGICGTGVIDAVYELKKEEIMDETGLMDDPYFEGGLLLSEKNGGIRFYQKDVRELQLAKSAVRAGLETLISKYGIGYEDIDHIYIAGGFGYQMDVRKAADIGLLPGECLDKISAAGNTCLKGTVKALTDNDVEERLRCLADMSKEVQLSNDKEFQEFYMEYMYFE